MLGMPVLPHKGEKQKGSKKGGGGIYHVRRARGPGGEMSWNVVGRGRRALNGFGATL